MLCVIFYSQKVENFFQYFPLLPLLFCGCNWKQHEDNVKSLILAAVHDG